MQAASSVEGGGCGGGRRVRERRQGREGTEEPGGHGGSHRAARGPGGEVRAGDAGWAVRRTTYSTGDEGPGADGARVCYRHPAGLPDVDAGSQRARGMRGGALLLSAPGQPRPVCDEGHAALPQPRPHRRSPGAAGSLTLRPGAAHRSRGDLSAFPGPCEPRLPLLQREENAVSAYPRRVSSPLFRDRGRGEAAWGAAARACLARRLACRAASKAAGRPSPAPDTAGGAARRARPVSRLRPLPAARAPRGALPARAAPPRPATPRPCRRLRGSRPPPAARPATPRTAPRPRRPRRQRAAWVRKPREQGGQPLSPARQPSEVRGLWESGRKTPSLNTLWEDFSFLTFSTHSLRISRSSRPEPRLPPRPAQQAAKDGGDAGTRWEHRTPWTGCPQEG